MQLSDLYPHVVPLSYFNLPDLSKQPSLEQFGVVHKLGHDVAWMLSWQVDGAIKNVHPIDLENHGFTIEQAEAAAMENLSRAIDAKTFTRQIHKTAKGFHCITWTGNWLTASCMVWPGLFEWARKLLETDEILVNAPQEQLLFIISQGDAEFRAAMQQYSDNAAEGLDKLISGEWFTLRAGGIAPFEEK